MIDGDHKDDEILIDNKAVQNDSFFYENELKNYMTQHENEKIKEDIQLLREMGYDRKMINKVYILLQPANIEIAINYLTEIGGISQHNFFENHNSNKDNDLCFICKKPKKYHLDYIPPELLVGTEYINQNNNQNDLFNNNNIWDYNYNEEEYNDDDSFNFSLEEERINVKKNNNIIKENNKFENKVICNICFEDIEENEKKNNSLPCRHICCTNCWINYFKTLITDAKVETIKCIQHNCKQKISEEFLFKFIGEDKKLIDKYEKFKLRAEIINDPNKKQCPKPDCESYLEKSNKSRYVNCKNGHKFCFECLRPPHGKSSCEEVLEKDFLKWKKNRIVKRCPRCNIFTEKNEGCNHMTCTSCKYQWCWLCLGEYNYGHFDRGKCKGHQFTKANSLKEAKKGIRPINYNYRDHHQNQHLCCFTLYSIFPCIFHAYNEPFDLYEMWERYLAIFVMWFFGFFLFAGVTMANITHDRIDFSNKYEFPYYIIGLLIAICLFICFQILFTCLITPFIIIALCYPYFIDNILMFLDINV